MTTRIQNRRGTAAEWSTANPVLADGEAGFEKDTGVFKVGDGVTAWNSLKPAGNSTFDPIGGRATVAGQYLYNADHLRRWRAKLADAQNAQCHVGVYGDSITWGAYSNNNAPNPSDAIFRTAGWVAQLRNLLGVRYGAVGEGYLATHLNTAASYMTLAGGALYGGPSRVGIMGTRAFISGTGQSATFTLPACTTVEIVYYWKQGSSGAFTYTIDGGASTASTAQTADGTYRQTITGLANTTHTLVITGVAAGYTEIIAVGAFTDTTKGVAVHRYGKSGVVLAQHFPLADPGTALTSADQATQMTSAITGLKTDLAIIALSANNATQYGPLTPAQHLTGLQAVTANIVGQGKSVLLMGGPPVNPAGNLYGTTYHQADYDANMKSVAAATDHVAYLDLKTFWKDWGSANGLGFYSDAIAHPSRAGMGDIANVVFDALTRAW